MIEKCVRLLSEDRYESIDILSGAIEDIAAELMTENSERKDLHNGFCGVMRYSAVYFLISSYK